MARLAWIQFVDQGGPSAGNELPSGGYPSHGLPSGGNINNDLPRPPGSIGTLPVFPFDPSRPSHELPNAPGHPDNSLPNAPARPSNPIQLHPGLRLVVKYVACIGFVGVPDHELPETPEPK